MFKDRSPASSTSPTYDPSSPAAIRWWRDGQKITDVRRVDELLNLHPGGVFLRREALDHGYDDRDLSQMVKAGVLARVRHGAYTNASTWSAADEVSRHVLRSRAVLLSHPSPVALSHVSGALVSGLRVWGADLSKVHLVRLDDHTARQEGDVVHHVGGWASYVVREVGGMPVLPAAVCGLGAAACNPLESGIVTLDSIYDLDVAGVEDLREMHQQLGSWPGSRRLQIALRLAEPGAQSVGESRLRYLCWAGHLPKPQLQYSVYDEAGGLIGTTDLAWPEHRLLGEFDGKVKFTRYLRRGETPSDAVFREKVREDRLREATGWSMARFVWSDLEDRHNTTRRLRTLLGRKLRP